MTPRLIVYYDGLCPLCSREIDHYRLKAPAGQVSFVDISTPDFFATEHGLDPVAVQKHLHVRLDGRVATGVDAFFAIWEVIPGFRWLRTFLSLPGVNWLARLFYELFAVVRPLLPKRTCASGACSVEVAVRA